MVESRLVEADPRSAGLDTVDVLIGNASSTSVYQDLVPADFVLVCRVLGNLPERDVRGTVERLPELMRTGGTVIWTRHREPPDLRGPTRQPRMSHRGCGDGLALAHMTLNT